MDMIDKMDKNSSENTELTKPEQGLSELNEALLADARSEHAANETVSMPISGLASLGSGFASMLPAFRTVTQSITQKNTGLYSIVNMNPGDVLKKAKDGNSWAAFVTPEGKSVFAKLQEATPTTVTSNVVMPVNPAIIMVAVTLYSIDQKLDQIAQTGKQILSFLENEKQSEVEADVETLSSIIAKYKFNWDNKHFVESNHKLVLDIQRTARKNMLSYQKKVDEKLRPKQGLIAQATVNAVKTSLLKDFQYYRLSLYTFAMASFLEILLSGNYAEENIAEIRDEIIKLSMDYREAFSKGSAYLEKMGKAAIEMNVLKGIGTAIGATGSLIGSIPLVNKGLADEFLQDSGKKLTKNASGMEQDVLSSFASINNPGTGIFVDKMKELIFVYNHASEIRVDKQRIYLMAG